MRRGYTNEEISKLFSEIQSKNITLSSDIICGFPEETDADFKETYQFIEKFQPDILNISKFTSRPGTTAKRMKQLDSTLIKQRSQLLTNLYHNYITKKNLRWNGWKGRVLIRGYQENKKFRYSGRTEFYKPIVFQEGKRNSITEASVISVTPQYLVGKFSFNNKLLEN
jgi:tRNA A37 methylthiotransferase MiaB